jgi:solute carrier family 25 phosphate transporter 3
LRVLPIDEENILTDTSMSRRDALLGISLLITVPTASASASNGKSSGKKSLEDLRIGNAEWKSQKDYASLEMNLKGLVISPSFATYATRLLINYDAGISSWWSETQTSYSLLSANDERSKMGANFGALSRSIQIAMETFVTQDAEISEDSIRQRFQELFDVFLKKYGSQKDTTNIDESKIRNICILFSILPAKYQPVNELKKWGLSDSTVVNETQKSNWSVALTEDLTQVLPSTFNSVYDSESKSCVIKPTVNFYEVGIDDEFGQNAIATAFGPLASAPLKRQDPNLPVGIYALFGLSGAAGCAITHTAVIPVDVVKTRLQTNPDEYEGILDGITSIAKSEGLQGFTLGSQATIAGYLWYGLSVYPTYR